MEQRFKYITLFVVLLLFILTSSRGFATEQNAKLWMAFNLNHSLTEDKKWLTFLYSQIRLIAGKYPVQTGLLETAIGFQITSDKNLWLGYRWSGHNPHNNFFQENRLFQQLIWKLSKNDLHEIVSRTRLEQLARGNESQVGIRLRQRITLELEKYIFEKCKPILWDEMFFQLRKTKWISTKFFNQNRLLLGVNLILSKNSWWEIGYLNQFTFATPQNKVNELSHVISLTYNFS